MSVTQPGGTKAWAVRVWREGRLIAGVVAVIISPLVVPWFYLADTQRSSMFPEYLFGASVATLACASIVGLRRAGWFRGDGWGLAIGWFALWVVVSLLGCVVSFIPYVEWLGKEYGW